MHSKQVCDEVSDILIESYPEIRQERVTDEIIGLGDPRNDELYPAAVNFEPMEDEGFVEFNAPRPGLPQDNARDTNEHLEDSNPQVLARRIAALYSHCTRSRARS